jgi:hypothetical protein
MAGLFGYRPTANIKRALTQVPEVRRQTRRAAAALRDEARPKLLRDTGAGARSVRVVSKFVDGANEYRVSWDRAHWYMGLHEKNIQVLVETAAKIQRGQGIAPADIG